MHTPTLSKHAKKQCRRLGVDTQEVIDAIRAHEDFPNFRMGRTYILVKRLPGIITLPAYKGTSTDWKEVQGNTIKAVYLRTNKEIVTTVMLGFWDAEDRDRYRRKGK